MLDTASVLDEAILEPIDEGDIVRTMSDVLLGGCSPMEEMPAAVFDRTQQRKSYRGLDEDRYRAIEHGSSPDAFIWQAGEHGAACTVALLLLPHLDFAA